MTLFPFLFDASISKCSWGLSIACWNQCKIWLLGEFTKGISWDECCLKNHPNLSHSFKLELLHCHHLQSVHLPYICHHESPLAWMFITAMLNLDCPTYLVGILAQCS
jgi:hypothetical protein